MKKAAIFLIVLAMGFSLVSCGCEHKDRDYNGFCDDCGEVLTEVGADEWKSAFAFTNAKVSTLEVMNISDGMGSESEYFVVNGVVYDENGEMLYSIEALSPYLAFSDLYDSFGFGFDGQTGKYGCSEITVGEITYLNVYVAFNAGKKLSTIEFEVESEENGRVSCAVTVSGHGATSVPNKE